LNSTQIRAMLESQAFSYMRWNTLYSAKHRLLYVPTPKVACTSLKWWFASLLEIPRDVFASAESGESDPELIIHDVLHRFAPEATCVDPAILAQSICDEHVLRFAVVRNPYQRIFSAWQSKLLIHEPQQLSPYRGCAFFDIPMESPGDIARGFEGFLEYLASNDPPDYGDPHWTPQVDLLRPDALQYTCVAQIEKKEPLLAAFKHHFGNSFVNPFAGSRANESLLHYSPRFFPERAESLIRQLYAEDFERFGYATTLPEAQVAVSDAELEVALRAVKLIRGRHARLEQMMSARPTSIGADEVSRLEARVSELLAACARLQEGNDWLESQRMAWEQRAGEQEEKVKELMDFAMEQKKAIDWYASQQNHWEQRVQALEAQLRSVGKE